MTEQDVRSLADPFRKPLFAPVRGHRIGLQDGDREAGLLQNRSQAGTDVPPVGMSDVHQQAPSARTLPDRHIHQGMLLRIEATLR